MASNVYTKNEILQNLAQRGYFIDAYTLDTFFEKWKVEAIFEDEQGSEFYDKNALELVLSNLFSAKNEEVKKEPEKEPPSLSSLSTSNSSSSSSSSSNISAQPQAQVQPSQTIIDVQPQTQPQQAPQTGEKLNIIDEDLKIEDSATANLLNNISLSDGTPLINKIQETPDFDNLVQPQQQAPLEKPEALSIPKKAPEEPKKTSILDSAMQAAGREIPQIPEVMPKEQAPIGDIASALNNINADTSDNGDFDDISLLSESLEAQEKFREYVVSELAKKNVDLNPKNSNEFKLDISERTISMIARTMAKKIAKHVSNIFSADAKNATQLEAVKEENKKLEQRARDLEEQNRKLRLLLTESNKNLNSYKPSIFGLYKKVNPGK